MVSNGFLTVTTSGQQYNIGEKPSVIVYTYINLHAGTPKPQSFLSVWELLIHTFSVLSLQLKKLRRHNKSAIDLSNANPACGHKNVRRSTGHIMVTTRYSDQQGSKSRQKVMQLYKQWHRPISNRFIKPSYSVSRATSIHSDCCRLPTTSVIEYVWWHRVSKPQGSSKRVLPWQVTMDQIYAPLFPTPTIGMKWAC